MRVLGEVLSLAVSYLKEKNIHSPRLSAEILLAQVLQKQRIELYMNFEYPLSEEELAEFRGLLRRAACLEPIEYITAEVEFYGCRLFVSNHVLIPRPETELLVDKAFCMLEKEKPGVILDLCCGSGCIGLSLKKKLPAMQVVLTDLSKEALSVCEENAKKNGVVAEFLHGDFLTPFEGRKADYVFCNPPYVTRAEYERLDESVKGFEPKMALVSGETGLEFYEKLEREIPSYLAPGAKVFLEIGTGQGQHMQQIFSSSFWKKKELFYDFAGHDRFFFLEIE